MTDIITTLIGELRQAMAGAGVGRIEQISRDLVRLPSCGTARERKAG